VAAGALLCATAACNDGTTTSPTSVEDDLEASVAARSAEREQGVGAVFVSTNAAAGNAVVAFRRAADGALSPIGTFPTGGRGIGGTADPLESQFALTLNPDRSLLFVVNAGSNDVSVFRVEAQGLELVDRKPSLGTRPVSVAAGEHEVYVLNAGSNNVGIYNVERDGVLSQLGVEALSGGAAGPAAIRLSRNGRTLAVTEQFSNTIDGFAVGQDGELAAPVSAAAGANGPFGFDYTPRGALVASDATSGAVTSYAQAANGRVSLLDGPVSTAGQAAPCWLIVDNGGRFAYTANAGGSSISGFSVSPDGTLTLITPGGRTGDLGTDAQPLDIDLSRDSRFLYILKNGTGTVGAFAVNRDGTLTGLADTPGLVAQAGYMGLAAY
jgi:6-phosphogluconolactonase (cycloisomerase 2 family)